jgi:Tfp pilus assembly protein PilF
MQKIPRRDAIFLLVAMVAGCSYPGEKQEDARRVAAEAYDKAQQAFASKDYATAGVSLTEAINAGGLNPDLLVDATAKRAVCWGATGKPTEAIESLQQIESWGEQQDVVLAARAYVLAKQGKVAESRAALAKARQYNRTVQEFKD